MHLTTEFNSSMNSTEHIVFYSRTLMEMASRFLNDIPTRTKSKSHTHLDYQEKRKIHPH